MPPSVVRVIKPFFGWNLHFPKVEKLKSLFWSLNLQKNLKNAIFLQNCTLKLLVVSNGPFLLFQFSGKSRFSRFRAKSFKTASGRCAKKTSQRHRNDRKRLTTSVVQTDWPSCMYSNDVLTQNITSQFEFSLNQNYEKINLLLKWTKGIGT